MTRITRALGTLAWALLVAGCAPSAYSGAAAGGGDLPRPAGTVTCSSLFDSIIESERRTDASGSIDAEVDALGAQCPAEYRVYVDYLSIRTFARIGAGGACSEYRDFDVQRAAIKLARQDGFCSGSSSSGSGNRGVGGANWTCNYRPTYDNDWHNDVVCSNGTDQHRPYLREWDSYITEDEIMESAREYERQLNGG